MIHLLTGQTARSTSTGAFSLVRTISMEHPADRAECPQAGQRIYVNLDHGGPSRESGRCMGEMKLTAVFFVAAGEVAHRLDLC